MRNKKHITSICLFMSLIFAILSMPLSAAISQGSLERQVSARIVKDSEGIIKIIGLDDISHDIDHKYKNLGSVKNNTTETITLSVTVKPDFGYNIFSKLSIKIGPSANEFRYLSSSPKQVSAVLSPGEEIAIEGTLIQNLWGVIPVDFDITATSGTGSFAIWLNSTSRTPRRVNLY